MPGWLTGVTVSAVTGPDAASWVAVTLVSALVFVGWVITCDLRTSRLRSLIVALEARRGRSDGEADEPDARAGAPGARELSEGRKEEPWTSQFRRRKG